MELPDGAIISERCKCRKEVKGRIKNGVAYFECNHCKMKWKYSVMASQKRRMNVDDLFDMVKGKKISISIC